MLSLEGKTSCNRGVKHGGATLPDPLTPRPLLKHPFDPCCTLRVPPPPPLNPPPHTHTHSTSSSSSLSPAVVLSQPGPLKLFWDQYDLEAGEPLSQSCSKGGK